MEHLQLCLTSPGLERVGGGEQFHRTEKALWMGRSGESSWREAPGGDTRGGLKGRASWPAPYVLHREVWGMWEAFAE
jgi:hypothetical protein